MKYSFVLPAYKAQFIRQAIDSILSQTYTEFELIIVNDASPEDLDSIVDSYSDSRIKYYKNQKNIGGQGLVKQWNYCISLCNSDYLILASDDDLYDIEYLSKLDELIDKYPEVDVFRPRIRYIDSDNQVTDISGYLKEFSSDLEWLEAWTKGWIGSGIPYYIFKRKALLSIGGFADYPLGWFADDATILRLLGNGIVSSSEFLFSFRVSGISITSRKNSSKDLENKLFATDMFYDEVISYLNNMQCSYGHALWLKNSVMKWFTPFMQDTKIRAEVLNTSLLNVVRNLKHLSGLGLLSKRKVIALCIHKVFSLFR